MTGSIPVANREIIANMRAPPPVTDVRLLLDGEVEALDLTELMPVLRALVGAPEGWGRGTRAYVARGFALELAAEVLLLAARWSEDDESMVATLSARLGGDQNEEHFILSVVSDAIRSFNAKRPSFTRALAEKRWGLVGAPWTAWDPSQAIAVRGLVISLTSVDPKFGDLDPSFVHAELVQARSVGRAGGGGGGAKAVAIHLCCKARFKTYRAATKRKNEKGFKGPYHGARGTFDAALSRSGKTRRTKKRT